MFMQVVKSAHQEWDNIVHTAFQDSETQHLNDVNEDVKF